MEVRFRYIIKYEDEIFSYFLEKIDIHIYSILLETEITIFYMNVFFISYIIIFPLFLFSHYQWC